MSDLKDKHSFYVVNSTLSHKLSLQLISMKIPSQRTLRSLQPSDSWNNSKRLPALNPLRRHPLGPPQPWTSLELSLTILFCRSKWLP